MKNTSLKIISVLVLLIGVIMLVTSPTIISPPFISGLGFVLVGVYFSLVNFLD